ncbi:MAG TPA: acyl-CoA dehydratase activase [Syntrophorhabdaceae bacterium]|nr:acyl-CoA dehydratase activase [Syntrophorhabdaceae bacterium]
MFVAGIDIGSLTAKAVILDQDARIVGQALTPTGAFSQRAGENAFEMALKMAGVHTSDIGYVLATGYGRKNIPFAHAEMTEISCHARGAHRLFPEARTVIDIGGQDSKAIALNESGVPVNFIMNDKCAAGCGRFLEVMARALETEVEKMGELSAHSTKTIQISSMCTVFAESEVVSAVANKCSRSDIINGIHQAIAKRVSIMVDHVGLVERVMMSGGVAKNTGVVRALESQLGTTLLVPEEPQLVGALGAAVIALERSRNMRPVEKSILLNQ